MSARREPGPPIAITGVGMRTAVGATWAQSTTSVMSGLNRFHEWPYLGADLCEDVKGLPVASAIADLGDDAWQTKAADLAHPALEEALFSASLFGRADLQAAHRRAALATYLAVPYRATPEAPDHEDALDAVVDSLDRLLPGFDEFEVVVEARAHASGLRCLAAAMRDLSEARIDVAIVGGIDSLLETNRLMRPIAEGRIKLADTAGGLIPGEGASFLVVERLADANRRRAAVRAMLLAVALADEPIRYDGTDPLAATGLTSCLLAILDQVDPHQVSISDVVVDVNGERGRFQEWALAESRSLHRLPYGWRLHHPATSHGDIGAAAGVANVALAAGLFALGRAAGDAALVCATSERGERACALIGSPTPSVQ